MLSKLKGCNYNAELSESWCQTFAAVKNYTYTWTIRNYSLRYEENDEFLESSTFPNDEPLTDRWCLRLYPNGDEESTDQYVSLFLHYLGSARIKAKFSFSILCNGVEKYEKLKELCSFAEGNMHGNTEFIDRNVLFDTNNGFLIDDMLTLRCKINMVPINCKIHIYGESLKIKKPECKLGQDLEKIFDDGKLTDVTLEIADREIQAHKIVLAARSVVFDAMFQHEMTESKENRISIIDFSYDVVKEMLTFIYTGKSPNLDKMPVDLLTAADKYAINGLKVLCEIELAGNICLENFAELLIRADDHNADQLKKSIHDFINSHFKDVSKTQDWQELIKAHTHLIAEILQAK